MKISHHEITDSGALRQVNLEECISGWQSGAGQYWLDVEHYEAGSAEGACAVSSARETRAECEAHSDGPHTPQCDAANALV